MYSHKNNVVEKLRIGIEQLFEANKVTLIRGKGVITGEHTVSVTGSEGKQLAYKAEKIILATGSKPIIPAIKGIENDGVYTSDDLLGEANKSFHSIIIIGGGVIGVEFAEIYRTLGCEVTIVEAMNSLLPAMDRDISQNMLMLMKKRGVKVVTNARVSEIKGTDNLSVIYEVEDKSFELSAEKVLVAIGRKPNYDKAFSEEMMPEVENGKVKINNNFETSRKGIYAIGDVSSSVQLAHVASAQAIAAVEMIAGITAHGDLKVVPSCVYSDPEIACVGVTADEAKKDNIPVKVGKFVMSANGKSVISMEDRGFIKVVVKEDSEIIIGAQLMCARATDMIGELSTAVANEMTVSQLSKAMRAHPTYNEAIAEALEALRDGAIHSAPKKKM